MRGFSQLALRMHGYEKVCLYQTATSRYESVCSILGFAYTSSIYRSQRPIETSWVVASTNFGRLSSLNKSCYHRISCRKSCNPLCLLNGNDCSYTLEGQKCNFACNPGYFLTGSASRTCTSYGWTGSHPFCDGKLLQGMSRCLLMVTDCKVALYFTSKTHGIDLYIIISSCMN